MNRDCKRIQEKKINKRIFSNLFKSLLKSMISYTIKEKNEGKVRNGKRKGNKRGKAVRKLDILISKLQRRVRYLCKKTIFEKILFNLLNPLFFLVVMKWRTPPKAGTNRI